MAGYITYWPQEQLRKLKKAGDYGPIKVVLGSVHTKMPSIAKVKVGDVIYPVTLSGGTLIVLARLPVERVETGFDYLLRETGDYSGALIPEGVALECRPFRGEDVVMYSMASGAVKKKEDLPAGIRIEHIRNPFPHLCHQEPFNCCTQTAASGNHGSTIAPRPIPPHPIPQLLFGPTKSRQKPLRTNEKGELTVMSLSGFVRKMSDETKRIFDSVFEEDENAGSIGGTEVNPLNS